jgi:hypothetical protein
MTLRRILAVLRVRCALVLSLSAVFTIALAGPAAAATPTWILKGSVKTGPVGRVGAAAAYFPPTKSVVLFGGVNDADGSTYLNDTWTWTGFKWIQQFPAVSPPARLYASLAYDAATGQLILFGGQGEAANLGDTWAWNGTTWTQLFPSSSPSPRMGAAAAYDVATQTIVLFGGSNNASVNAFNDTWLWNGATWTLSIAPTVVPARYGAGMAYDPTISSVVLFGGGIGSDLYALGDTWIWNGTSWSAPVLTSAPPRAPELRLRLRRRAAGGGAFWRADRPAWLGHRRHLGVDRGRLGARAAVGEPGGADSVGNGV